MNERTLPHSLEAERAVLGAVLLDGDRLAPAALVLEDGDFYAEANRLIFEVMLELQGAGDPIDGVTVIESLQNHDQLDRAGGAHYVSSLMDGLPRGTNVGHYAGIVHEHAVRRSLVSLSNEIITDALTLEPPRQIVDVAGRGLAEAAVSLSRSEGVAGTGERPSELAMRSFIDPSVVVDLGWPRLCGRMGSRGLPRGDILTVVACTTVGKTTFALQTVERVMILYPNDHVPFFSLEMPANQLMFRMMMGYCKATKERLAECMSGEAIWPDSDRSAVDFDRAARNVHVIEDRWSVIEMEAAVQALQPVSLVVIDYLQNIKVPGATTLFDRTDPVMRDLKEMAKRQNVAVVMLSQVPKSIAGPQEMPKLRSAKGSGAIADGSDFVLGMCRPHIKRETEAEARESLLRATLLKSKHGWPGSNEYEYDLVRQRIEER